MSDVTATSSPVKISWLIGVAAAFLIFAAIGIYSTRMTNDYEDYDQQQAQIRYAKLAKYRDETTKTLTSAAWVDQDRGIIRIPIEEAMMKEVDVLKGATTMMGQEIPGAKPAAPKAPAPAVPAPSTNAAPVAAQPPATKDNPGAPAPAPNAPVPTSPAPAKP
jgi:hypothetical protein